MFVHHLTFAALLIAVGTLSAHIFYIPAGVAKCFPVQHAINVLNGQSELTKLSDVMKAYGKYTPNAKWNGSFYTDVNTGVRAKNHVLIYQDTYMMGKGYMNATSITVPEKYFTMK